MTESITGQKAKNETSAQADLLFGRQLYLRGITAMIESNEKEVVAQMQGHTLYLSGENLKIEALDTTTQTALISGSVQELRYKKGKEKLSFLKRIFR